MRLALVTLFIFSAACGRSTVLTEPSSQCPSGVAIIQVQDSFLEGLCGCSEGRVLAQVGESFACSVAENPATVIFRFDHVHLKHQVQSQGSPSFASSGVYDPNHSPSLVDHAVVLSTSGSYQFVDSFNSQIEGTISVP